MNDPEQDIARGHRARQELTETEAAFDTTREAIVRAMLATSVTSPDKILRLHAAAQALEAARTALMITVANGSHAHAAREALAEANLTRPN